MEKITISEMPPVKNEEQKRHLVRYVNFINSRPGRDLVKDGKWTYEVHHIIPRSLNDLDENNNLIKLTLREHFIAHMILWKCGYSGMAYAFLMMNNFGRYKKYINSRMYEILKTDCSKLKKYVDFTRLGNIYCTNGIDVFYFSTPKEAYKILNIHPNSRMLYENRTNKTNRLFCGSYNNIKLMWGSGNIESVSKKQAIENYIEQCNFLYTKRRNARLGKKHSEQAKINIGKSRVYPKGKSNQFFGKKHSKEMIEKQKLSIKKYYEKIKVRQNSIKVICLNTNKIYNSITDAHKETGATNISACCRGLRNYSGVNENGEKLQWAYV